MKEIIKNPDYILEDTKNIETIILLKKICEEKVNIYLVIKLSTGTDKKKK